MTVALEKITPAQMLILKSFADITSEEDLQALMKMLKKFYAQRLETELDDLWEKGCLDENRLNEMQSMHFRVPSRE